MCNVQNNDLTAKLLSDKVLDHAYLWLSNTRRHANHNNSVWHLRSNWPKVKQGIRTDFEQGCYFFEPAKAIQFNGHSVSVFNARDSLLQKAMSIVLNEHLQDHFAQNNAHCYHIKGHGGAKTAVTRAADQCGHYQHVLKSDVKSYYASINHQVLLKQIKQLINDKVFVSLIAQFIDRLDDVNAELYSTHIGIAKGASLSPILGAIYLSELDQCLEQHATQHQLFYARFMDDWILLTHTKRQLRTGVRLMNQVLNRVQMQKAPDKTFIGRIAKGFDFLGYRLGPDSANGVQPAQSTLDNHNQKLHELQQQGASQQRIEDYIKRWNIWLNSGVTLSKPSISARPSVSKNTSENHGKSFRDDDDKDG